MNLNAGPATPGTGSASSCSQLEETSPATRGRLVDTDAVTVEDQLTMGVKPLQPEAGMLPVQELAKHAMCASVTAPGYSTIAARSPLRMVGWLTKRAPAGPGAVALQVTSMLSAELAGRAPRSRQPPPPVQAALGYPVHDPTRVPSQ